MSARPEKVGASHLERDAYLYVRQSTLRQVLENTESTHRQYALEQRAIGFGWPPDQIHVIDCDQGHSGASAADREGFQRLVSEVSLGRAGIVLGLEVSRLARNCADWQRLIQICSVTETLILDEDGLYDPNDFNDRLLLGLKGTMSEAELHFIQSRLRGGILSKVRRGEYKCALPTGLVYDDEGQVRLDPDRQVRQTIQIFFETFRRTGSAGATVRYFDENNIVFPRRICTGPDRGQVGWGKLSIGRAVTILHHPRYAGAFCFGRRRSRKRIDGRTITKFVPRDEWDALFPDSHEGYIEWDEFEANQLRLRQNRTFDPEARKTPPREGVALLQGIVFCGICGRRMSVGYHTRCGETIPTYRCDYERRNTGTARVCQSIAGRAIEKAIADLLMDKLKPVAIEVTLAVQKELADRIEEADRLRQQHLERIEYDVKRARRRYMKVDPDNRLVASALEAEYNQKLRDLQQAQKQYERERQKATLLVDQQQRDRLMELATDFPRLWNDPNTSPRDRKRMVRLLIEDVMLTKADDITVCVRFKGGATTTLTLPLTGSQVRCAPPELVAEIDQLLDHHTDAEIAQLFIERGQLSPRGRKFRPPYVAKLRRKYGLKSRFDRLRETGLLTIDEIAAELDVCTATIRTWRIHGLLQAHKYNDNGEWLFERPGADRPLKAKGRKLSHRSGSLQVLPSQS